MQDAEWAHEWHEGAHRKAFRGGARHYIMVMSYMMSLCRGACYYAEAAWMWHGGNDHLAIRVSQPHVTRHLQQLLHRDGQLQRNELQPELVLLRLPSATSSVPTRTPPRFAIGRCAPPGRPARRAFGLGEGSVTPLTRPTDWDCEYRFSGYCIRTRVLMVIPLRRHKDRTAIASSGRLRPIRPVEAHAAESSLRPIAHN